MYIQIKKILSLTLVLFLLSLELPGDLSSLHDTFIRPVQAATTGTLSPVGNGGENTGNTWQTSAGVACAVNGANCFDEVNDVPPTNDGNTSYIRNTSTASLNSVTFNVDLSGIPDTSTITAISITFVCMRPDSTTGTVTARSVRRLDGTSTVFGSNATCPGSSTGYQSFTQNHTGLTIQKLSSTDLEVGLRTQQGRQIRVTSMYADITFTPPPNITVGKTGTQTLTLDIPSSDQYIGGAFTFMRGTGSANITQIVLTESGSVNANQYVSNLKAYYKQEDNCSSLVPGDATVFNASGAGFNASEKATITGTMPVGTSQVCLYVKLDIMAGAAAGQTIDIEISNPTTDIITSSGTISPNTVVAIDGATTLSTPSIVSVTLTSDGQVTYGTIPPGTAKSTKDLSDTQIAKNDGNVTETLNIKTTNAIGGASWTLGSSPGDNTFVHEFSVDGGSNWIKCTSPDTYQTLVTGVAPNASQSVDLRITAPSSSSDYQEKNITITIQAVQQ